MMIRTTALMLVAGLLVVSSALAKDEVKTSARSERGGAKVEAPRTVRGSGSTERSEGSGRVTSAPRVERSIRSFTAKPETKPEAFGGSVRVRSGERAELSTPRSTEYRDVERRSFSERRTVSTPSSRSRETFEPLRKERTIQVREASGKKPEGPGAVTASYRPNPDGSDRKEREEFNRRLIRLAGRGDGPISPSQWEAHREAQRDGGRGDGDGRRDGDGRWDGDGRRDGDGDRDGRWDGDDRRDGDRRWDGDRRDGDGHWDNDNDRDGDHRWDRDGRHDRDDGPRPTEIWPGHRSHRHHENCGHYFYDNDWHEYSREHRHHDGCGHHYYDNDWHRWPRGHRHHAGCGHHYYDGDWFDFPRGHKHGPHCGHHYYDGDWHYYSKDHHHGHGCGHHYYDGDWHYWPRTHRHYPGCGHYYFNFFWYPFPPTYYGYQETVIVSSTDVGPTTLYVDDYEGPARDHAARGYEKAQRGDYYGAIAAFSTAIATTTDNGPLYLAQGLAYMQVGDYRSAYTKIMEGLRRTPDLADGHPDLQGLIADPEHVEWRILELMNAIDASPENEKPILVLGYLQFLKGDYEGAKLALQAVAGLDPSNEEAPRLLQFIYEIENEDDGAAAAGA